MDIIPAIDIKDGRCVRLLKGDFNQVSQYDVDPVTMALRYADAGARQLHVVDLDGAKNQATTQLECIKAITAVTSLTVQTGGGIRQLDQIYQLLDHGVERVVIGSLAVQQPERVQQWLAAVGRAHIVIALDVRFIEDDYYCATHGWQSNSSQSLWQCLANYNDLQYLLCTDIECDGTLAGPNVALYQQIQQRYPDVVLQASGGISSIDDIKQLAMLNIDNVIVGKALYENKLDLAEALSLC